MRLMIRQSWKLPVGLLLALGGGVAILSGWSSVRNLLEVADQVPHLISGGIGGLALVLAGVWLLRSHETGLIVEHLRENAERLDRIEEAMTELSAVFDGAHLEEVEPASTLRR